LSNRVKGLLIHTGEKFNGHSVPSLGAESAISLYDFPKVYSDPQEQLRPPNSRIQPPEAANLQKRFSHEVKPDP